MTSIVEEAREVVRAVADQAALEGVDLAHTPFAALAENIYLYDIEYGDDLDGDEVGDEDVDSDGAVHPGSGTGDLVDDDPDAEDIQWVYR